MTTVHLHVAICTNRSPAAVAACLRALAAEGVDGEVLLVASGLDEAAITAHRDALALVLPGARLLSEPRPGLSLARNAALAAVADDVVLAFVDDDAVVRRGWREAMTAAWRDAPERTACVGGPI